MDDDTNDVEIVTRERHCTDGWRRRPTELKAEVFGDARQWNAAVELQLDDDSQEDSARPPTYELADAR